MTRTLRGPSTPTRRIAVIELPRLGRVGSIGPAGIPNGQVEAWTTIGSDQPSTADNWLAFVLQRQTQTRETTPGTLLYTPSPGPGQFTAPVQAAWNSWGGDQCNADGSAPVAPAPDYSWLLIGASVLTAVFMAANYFERKR